MGEESNGVCGEGRILTFKQSSWKLIYIFHSDIYSNKTDDNSARHWFLKWATLKLVAPERCVGQHLHAAVRRVRPWGTDTAGYCRTATQHSLLPALSLSLMASFRMNKKWQVTLSDPDIQTKFMTTHPHSDSHALTSNQAWSQTQTSGPDLWRCSHRLHWWLLLEEVDCVWNDVSRTWHCLRGAQVCRLLHAG